MEGVDGATEQIILQKTELRQRLEILWRGQKSLFDTLESVITLKRSGVFGLVVAVVTLFFGYLTQNRDSLSRIIYFYGLSFVTIFGILGATLLSLQQIMQVNFVVSSKPLQTKFVA
jgi:hypothetical protein